jgi:hypothetical protein
MRGEPGGDEGIPATNVEMDWIELDWIGLDWIGLDDGPMLRSEVLCCSYTFPAPRSYNTVVNRRIMRRCWFTRNSMRLMNLTQAGEYMIYYV